MLRFRNPGSNLRTQLRILKNIYNLRQNTPISLEDMKTLATEDGMMTSHGYAGSMAIELNRDNSTSRDGVFNNVKMYAEIFRMLGIFSPVNESQSYPIMFSYLGQYVAGTDDPESLVEECFWGMNNPNNLTDQMTYDERVRFVKCTLRMMIDLGGVIYKHEMCMGSMSVNDDSETEYQSMLNRIRSIRGNKKRLEKSFNDFANSLRMQTTSVDNCTRFPIGLLKYFGYVEDVRNNTLYNASLKCLKITKKGREKYEYYSKMKDIRLKDYNSCNKSEQNALIRLGMYSMLKRAGFNMESVNSEMEADKITLKRVLNGKELLFSPCATLQRKVIERIPEFKINLNASSTETSNGNTVFTRNLSENIINTLKMDFSNQVDYSKLTEDSDRAFLNSVKDLKTENKNAKEIVEILFKSHKDDRKDVFYPLISTLFKIIGFDSEPSREGDNGSRFDVVIKDAKRSIPIEVKSPTEEDVVNVKAIRQALENKIVMLSRKKFITDKNTTSIALGYELPNERADIQTLVSAIKETYGFKISVLGFKSLLSMAVHLLIDGKTVNKELIFNMEGLNDAEI